MDKGETVMPVPEGIISTSTGPAEAVQEVVPVAEAIKIIKEEDAELLERLKEADAEEAVEEYDLPELS
jgi:hypothetical protein